MKDSDCIKDHEQTIIWLAEEEAAFNTVSQAAARAITLRKEYQRMNEVMLAPQTDLLAAITAAARDPSVDVGKIQILLETAERIAKFNREREFNNAMRSCQEAIAPIAKTAENKHTGAAYTPLETIDREIRPVYTSHGFVMSFGSGGAKGEHTVRVTCDVRHSSGHTVQYELEGELDTAGLKGASTKTGIQGLGSTVTHLRRYLTLMIWNITLTERPIKLAITGEQAGIVRSMLDRAGITADRLERFLVFAQADAIESILPSRYSEVIKALKRAEDYENGRKRAGREAMNDKITPRAEDPRA
jgi:hypothetical protein